MKVIVGQRVKLTKLAFERGVERDTPKTRAYRGTVVRMARVPGCVVVKWDHRKTPERLHMDFVNKAVATHSRAALRQ